MDKYPTANFVAANPALNELKVEGYAFYLDADYNYGPGNVNLAGWWSAGPSELDLVSDPGSQKLKGMVGMGSCFTPLIVAYGYNGNGWNRGATTAIGVANQNAWGDYPGYDDGNTTWTGQANHWALNLSGAHAFTDDLTLTYALAYLSLTKAASADYLEGLGNTDFGLPGAEAPKKSIGFEVDLGLQVQLLDNLKFGTTFGYLFAGDALRTASEENGNFRWKDAEDSYTWLNTLTFSF
jgi:hypothetical protein